MKIGIQTWGSTGDIRPFVALSMGLAKRGHEVTLATASVDARDHSYLTQPFGIKYINIINDSISQNLESRLEKDITLFINSKNPLTKFFIILERCYFPVLGNITKVACDLAHSNDFLVGNNLSYPLKIAARENQKKFISVTLCHGVVPSKYSMPHGFNSLGILNPLIWEMGSKFMDHFLKKTINKYLKNVNLPPINGLLDDFLFSDMFNLIAVSKMLTEQQKDWKNKHKVCGYFNIPENSEKWELPADLKKFLLQGQKPVYIFFGSLQQLENDEIMKIAIDASKIAGCKTIIQTLSDTQEANYIDGNIYYIGRAPHHHIFPHCVAVVHHGGAGTTHTVTRAGCPSIIVEYFADQEIWGRELKKRNIGYMLSRRTLTAKKLAKTIKNVLINKQMQDKANKAGKEMMKEDGVSKAVNIIENFETII